MEKVAFIKDASTGVEVVSLEQVNLSYPPGVISIMPAKVHHEVHAGEEGLFLFAKFMPALC